ncbi:MAG: YlbF family regulator [Bacilli bacterium]|nr:YlbF family regulator [Bacilli bacterium]
MENYLTDKTEKSLDDIIKYIKSQEEYKNVIKLRQLMKQDPKLLEQIEQVKRKQKEYIRSQKDKEIEKELEKLKEELEDNILYFEYNINLNKVNEMISLVKDELNNYFYNLTNILK